MRLGLSTPRRIKPPFEIEQLGMVVEVREMEPWTERSWKNEALERQPPASCSVAVDVVVCGGSENVE